MSINDKKVREQFKKDKKLCIFLFRKHWQRMANGKDKFIVYGELRKKYSKRLKNIKDTGADCFLCDFRNTYRYIVNSNLCLKTCIIDWSPKKSCLQWLWPTNKLAISKLPTRPMKDLELK
jgi:hypothetical protein